MEVKLSELVIPNQLNFSSLEFLSGELDENKDGSYSKSFAEFINKATSDLREAFVENAPEQNRAEHLRVFDSSGTLVRNTMELIWEEKFICSDYERKLKALEERKNAKAVKLEFFKQTLDKLTWWKRTARHLNPRSRLLFSLANIVRLLKSITSEVEQVVKLYVKVSRNISKNMTKIVSLLEGQARLYNAGNADIAARLRMLLYLEQYKLFQEGWQGLDTLLDRHDDILNFNKKWLEWVEEEVRWSEECRAGNHWNAVTPQTWPKAPVIW